MYMAIRLDILSNSFSVFKVNDLDELNEDIHNGEFYSVTVSHNEISVICEGKYAPPNNLNAWRFLKYSGSLDDGVIGVVASITQPLANAGISVFVNTTYEHGYFGVLQKDLALTIQTLKGVGVTVE